MTTPNTQTTAPTNRDDGGYRPHSTLAAMLAASWPKPIGVDANYSRVYPLTAEDLAAAETNAACAASSLLFGLAVVGKLMIHAETNELSAGDWNTLGDLITTASESAHALLEIAAAARDAVPGIPGEGAA